MDACLQRQAAGRNKGSYPSSLIRVFPFAYNRLSDPGESIEFGLRWLSLFPIVAIYILKLRQIFFDHTYPVASEK